DHGEPQLPALHAPAAGRGAGGARAADADAAAAAEPAAPALRPGRPAPAHRELGRGRARAVDAAAAGRRAVAGPRAPRTAAGHPALPRHHRRLADQRRRQQRHADTSPRDPTAAGHAAIVQHGDDARHRAGHHAAGAVHRVLPRGRRGQPRAGRAAGGRVSAVPWVFLPLAGAFLAHAPVLRFDWLPHLKQPLDGGATWRGRRLFGDNKTWRGALAMSAGVVLLALLLSRWDWYWRQLPGEVQAAGPLVLGLLCGLGAVLAELPGSFLK